MRTHTRKADHEHVYQDDVLWYALGGTALVTLGGNLAILFVIYVDMSTSVLKLMVSFAMGGLLGDVFLHLLPHASHNHDHDHHHDHDNDHDHGHNIAELLPGLCVLFGIFSFFLFEKYLRSHQNHQHHHHDYNLRQRNKRRKRRTLKRSNRGLF